MVDDDSDYELIPKKEIEKIKKELNALKRNPYGESDRGQDLQKSIERLNNTMNKLIAILEDAQQDIIDEYNESKPIEKLNQILDQNETIAKALVSIHDKIGGASNPPNDTSDDVSHIENALPIPDTGPIVVQTPQMPRPGPQVAQQPMQQMAPLPQFNPQPFQQRPQQPTQQFSQSQQQSFQQPMQQQFAQQQRPPPIQNQQFPKQQMNQAPDFAPLPPLDSILPPLEGLDTQQMDTRMLPEQRKKKFLGLIG